MEEGIEGNEGSFLWGFDYLFFGIWAHVWVLAFYIFYRVFSSYVRRVFLEVTLFIFFYFRILYFCVCLAAYKYLIFNCMAIRKRI